MISVLVVEDEADVAAAHAAYVERCEGFEAVEVVHCAADAAAYLRGDPGSAVDLVLLDFNLPDQHGLDLARELRNEGTIVDVMAITAARDLEMVRGAVSIGITQYLIKPFTFGTFAERMDQYRQYRSALGEAGKLTQLDVDRALRALRTTNDPGLAKGLSSETLDSVAALIRASVTALSASEVAAELQLSRVTARRYLEHLHDIGLVNRSTRRGVRGRPEMEYSLSA